MVKNHLFRYSITRSSIPLCIFILSAAFLRTRRILAENHLKFQFKHTFLHANYSETANKSIRRILFLQPFAQIIPNQTAFLQQRPRSRKSASAATPSSRKQDFNILSRFFPPPSFVSHRSYISSCQYHVTYTSSMKTFSIRETSRLPLFIVANCQPQKIYFLNRRKERIREREAGNRLRRIFALVPNRLIVSLTNPNPFQRLTSAYPGEKTWRYLNNNRFWNVIFRSQKNEKENEGKETARTFNTRVFASYLRSRFVA